MKRTASSSKAMIAALSISTPSISKTTLSGWESSLKPGRNHITR